MKVQDSLTPVTLVSHFAEMLTYVNGGGQGNPRFAATGRDWKVEYTLPSGDRVTFIRIQEESNDE